MKWLSRNSKGRSSGDGQNSARSQKANVKRKTAPTREWRHRELTVDGWRVHVIEKPIQRTYLRLKSEREAAGAHGVGAPAAELAAAQASGAEEPAPTAAAEEPRFSLQVTCPFRTPDAYIATFVRQNEAWIARAIKREINRAADRRENPSADLRTLAETASAAQLKEWRAVVEACVPALIEQWESILGVKAGKLAYRKMVSRWGSCQPATGRICINILLAAYPPQCLEYVVVHELCHLLVRGHDRKFYGLLDRVMPDWRARKKLLN